MHVLKENSSIRRVIASLDIPYNDSRNTEVLK